MLTKFVIFTCKTCKAFEYILTTNVEFDQKRTLEFHKMGNLASPIVMHSNRTAALGHCLTKTCVQFQREPVLDVFDLFN